MSVKEKIEIGYAFVKWLEARVNVAKSHGKASVKQQYAYEDASANLKCTFRRYGYSANVVDDISEALERDVNT